MLSMKNGQTVGKMALRLRVVRPDGSPITTGQAWGRAVMRLVLGCLCDRRLHPLLLHGGEDDAARHGRGHARGREPTT